MRTSDLDYQLPEELIAHYPTAQRDGAKMLVVPPQGELSHACVAQFPDQLSPEDLLVLNETRVRKARLFCRRPVLAGGQGGGKAELLFLHPLGERLWSALGHAGKPLRVGDELELPGDATCRFIVREKNPAGELVVEAPAELEQLLLDHGHMPLPPYMERDSERLDEERYQTVFGRQLGSAAAPTAGLHLTEAGLQSLHARGVRVAKALLHVGLGTFRPVTAEDLDQHPMHSEFYEVSPELVDAVRETRARGGRVVAVGTTAVRALESAASRTRPGQLEAQSGQTRLLIQPGYQFQVVDALLTNFHMPKSTLLALVSAFVGYERLMSAYRLAIEERYRFLSYGDAMWLPRRLEPAVGA